MADIRKIAQAVREAKPDKPPKKGKANRTFVLSEPQASTFLSYVRSKKGGPTPSEVIDSLIEAFLREVADDLPLDLDSILPDEPMGDA